MAMCVVIACGTARHPTPRMKTRRLGNWKLETAGAPAPPMSLHLALC